MLNKYFKGVIVILLLGFVAIPAFSQYIELSLFYEKVKDTVDLSVMGDYAQYTIYLQNNINKTLYILPYSISESWIVNIYPPTVELGPKSVKNITIKLYPRRGQTPSTSVTIFFSVPDLNKVFDIVLPIKITGEPQNITPQYNIDYGLTKELVAGEELEGFIYIKNLNELPVSYIIKVSSPAFYEPYYLYGIIPPYGELSKRFKIKTRENAVSSYYSVNFEVNLDGKVYEFSDMIYLKEKPKNVTFIVNKKDGKTELVAYNYGELPTAYTLTYTTSKYKLPFYKFSRLPDYVYYSGGKAILGWNVLLYPGESKRVVIEFNYLPIFVIFLPLILAFVYLFFKRLLQFNVIVYKRLLGVNRKEGIIRIAIHVANKSFRTLKHVRVREEIPSIFELVDEWELRRPDNIIKSGNKTILSWYIDELGSGDEMVFEYKIKYSVEPVGTVILDGTKVIREGKVMAESQPLYIHFVGKK